MAASAPVMSMAASAPTPPVSFRTSAGRSHFPLLKVTSAPISRAMASFSSNRSQAMTFFAPNTLQALTAVNPMGPQPLTSTVLPATSADSTPWTPAPMGSNMQAASSLMSSSMGKVQSARILAYSAKAPSWVTPNSFTFPQMWGIPFWQNQHSPQGIWVSQETRWPT